MTKLAEIRAQYPMYDDMPDDQFVKAFHDKHYSDLDFKDFSKRIGYRKGADPANYDPQSPEFKAGNSPASDSSLANAWTSIGRSAYDLYVRGPGQLLGNVSREDVADSRARDKPLMDTTAGKVGGVMGSMMAAAPLAAIPGANTLAGGAAIGAGMGLLQPSTSTKETVTNTAIGGVASPLAMLAGRGLVGAGRGLKAGFIDPLTKGGQERIAARTLQGFAGGADEAAQAANNIRTGLQDVLPGVQPTTAELANNGGIANLERILKNNPEYLQSFVNRGAQNRNAMLSAVDGIAGDDVARSAAVADRSAAVKPLYGAADNVVVKADDELTKLLSRPSLKKAVDRASSLAAENGETFSLDTLSGKNLHTLKMAMDDLLDNPQVNGIGKNEANAIKGTSQSLLGWIEKNLPTYKQARTTFAEKSAPINQMDVGSAIRDKLTPAISDFGATTRLRPESFAQAMRNGDATAAKALDRGSASIDQVMTPEQMKTLTQVGEQLGRRVNADELGKAVGSNTGQNLIGQNVMRQFLGPLGLPEKFSERAASGPLLSGIMGLPSKIAEKTTGTIGEPNILKKLVELGLSPEQALALLEKQLTQGPGMLRYQGAIAPAVSGANAASK